ncbi:MAG: hypothetical protein U0Q21_15795 [Dermatophilaceae bacterium]
MALSQGVAAWRAGLLPKASLVLGATFVVCMVVAQDGVGWVSLILWMLWTR